MKTVKALVDFLADTLGEDPTRAMGLARVLREGGYLPTQGRGRGRIPATARDAAMMLLAIATVDKEKDSIEYAEQLWRRRRAANDNAPAALQPYLDAGDKTDSVGVLEAVLWAIRAGDEIGDVIVATDGLHVGTAGGVTVLGNGVDLIPPGRMYRLRKGILVEVAGWLSDSEVLPAVNGNHVVSGG